MQTSVNRSSDKDDPVNQYPREKAARISFDELVGLVCQDFGLTWEQLKSPTRKREVVRPRQVLMYLACLDTRCSAVWIGRRLGRKGHNPVLYGKRMIQTMLSPELQEDRIRNAIFNIERAYL